MDDKQLLAQFAAAALTGLLAAGGAWSLKNEDGEAESGPEAMASAAMLTAEAMLDIFKQRTEQKGNGND